MTLADASVIATKTEGRELFSRLDAFFCWR